MKRNLTHLISLFYKLTSIFENPIWAGLLGLAVYLAYAQHVNPTLRASPTNFHNYLADAFLHGQLYLRLVPPSHQDLSLFNQHFYLYFPPLPAVLMMPFVALFGINFSDVLFTVVVASLSVALVALLLRKAQQEKIIELTAFQRSLLVLFFAFGTVHFTVAPYGRVWFTSSATGFFFVILAYLAAISLKGKRAFFWTGAALASAMMCRNTLLFVGIWPAFFLILKSQARNWKDLIAPVLLGLLPVFVMGAAFLAYNWARFGDPFESGPAYQILNSVYTDDVNTYGFFDIHYARRNLYYHFIYYPLPETAETLHGGSLFLLSPVFFTAFMGMIRGKARLSVLFLVATIVATYIPILLYLGHGWFQFGPRYTLDFTVPLLLLTAIGIRWVPDWLLILLSLISAAQFHRGMSILNMIWRTP
jgi:hypothetical protein